MGLLLASLLRNIHTCVVTGKFATVDLARYALCMQHGHPNQTDVRTPGRLHSRLVIIGYFQNSVGRAVTTDRQVSMGDRN